MRASVVIPVWNGAEVIGQCLAALFAPSSDLLLEVIGVDNDSRDESARVIAERFPQVRLLRQPVNLGFAGGVNVGIHAAQGDVVVLLNQDCVPQTGWLPALAAAFEAYPEFGIAGCTIYFADGRLDHAGAHMTRPSALGEHLTDLGNGQPRTVDYVTGAAMAVRRVTFDTIGLFDEGFYPAYYEECDFCYRARMRGLETAYVPGARLTHLRSSREAQADPVKHWANQQRARYRFVIKQFTPQELGDFIVYETGAAETERDFDRAVGRLIGARDILRGLPDIIERRRIDCAVDLSPAVRRQLQTGFTIVLRRSFAVAEQLGALRPLPELHEVARQWQAADRQMRSTLGLDGNSVSIGSLMRRIVGRPAAAGATGDVEQLRQQLQQLYQLFHDQREQLDRRLTLLEILADYEYR